MNNSLVIEEYVEEPAENLNIKLRAEEARLLRIIEALKEIQTYPEWSTLKIEVFDNLVNVLEKELKTESKKEDPDSKKLNRLSGELKWAEKYSDLFKLEKEYRSKLQNVRTQLHGKTE